MTVEWEHADVLKEKGLCCCLDVKPHALHEFVYLLIFDGDIVKIGRSENPSQRLSQHISACSVKMVEAYIFSVLDSTRAERTLLDWFENFRLTGGEWFVIPEISRNDVQRPTKFSINGVVFWPYAACRPTCELCEALKELSVAEELTSE